jgi:hypothetical protein
MSELSQGLLSMPRSINPLLVRSPPTSTNIMHGLPDGCDCCLPQYAFGNHCKLRCESLLSLDWDLSSGICARHTMASGITPYGTLHEFRL